MRSNREGTGIGVAVPSRSLTPSPPLSHFWRHCLYSGPAYFPSCWMLQCMRTTLLTDALGHTVTRLAQLFAHFIAPGCKVKFFTLHQHMKKKEMTSDLEKTTPTCLG